MIVRRACWAQIRPELQALYPALAAADRPATVKAWLNKSAPAIVREPSGQPHAISTRSATSTIDPATTRTDSAATWKDG